MVLVEEVEAVSLDLAVTVAEAEEEAEEERDLEDMLMEVEVAPFLQTKESPWMAPLLCRDFKGEQEKLPETVLKVAPPLTDFKEDKSKVVKLPVMSMAPPTVWTFFKPSMVFKLVLLATTRPPPTEVKFKKDNWVKSSLETTERD